MRLSLRLLLLSSAALAAVATGVAAPATAADKTQVTLLTIGYPDKDTTDANTGAIAPGIDKLEARHFLQPGPGRSLPDTRPTGRARCWC